MIRSRMKAIIFAKFYFRNPKKLVFPLLLCYTIHVVKKHAYYIPAGA